MDVALDTQITVEKTLRLLTQWRHESMLTTEETGARPESNRLDTPRVQTLGSWDLIRWSWGQNPKIAKDDLISWKSFCRVVFWKTRGSWGTPRAELDAPWTRLKSGQKPGHKTALQNDNKRTGLRWSRQLQAITTALSEDTVASTDDILAVLAFLFLLFAITLKKRLSSVRRLFMESSFFVQCGFHFLKNKDNVMRETRISLFSVWVSFLWAPDFQKTLNCGVFHRTRTTECTYLAFVNGQPALFWGILHDFCASLESTGACEPVWARH